MDLTLGVGSSKLMRKYSISSQGEVSLYNCGQSYKHFMLIIYESRVVIWGIFKSGTTLES